MTIDTNPAKAQLKARMEAIIAANPVSVPREAQAEFDSCLASIKVLEQVGKASLAGVDLNNVAITTAGAMVGRRVTDSQSQVAIADRDGLAAATAKSTAGGRRKPRILAEDLFGKRAPKSEWPNLESWMFDIAQGNQKAMMASGASGSVPSDGGYAIPTQFVYENLNASVENEIVRPRCRVEAMTTSDKTIATWDDSTHGTASGNSSDSNLFGGLHLTWIAEGADNNYQTAKMRQVKLIAKKAVLLVPATNELLADAPSFAAGVTDRMVTALGFGIDRACLITGTGAGMPLGCLLNPSTITVDGQPSQPTLTLQYENFTKMLSRLHPGCWNNAIWIFHQSCLPQLLQLSIPIGVAGAYVPVLTESNGTYKILGRPVIFSEKMNQLGSLGDCMLVDLSQYIMGIHEHGFRLDQSSHLLFKSDETVWRLIVRLDGQSTFAKAFQPLNSAPTLSWCVTLKAR